MEFILIGEVPNIYKIVFGLETSRHKSRRTDLRVLEEDQSLSEQGAQGSNNLGIEGTILRRGLGPPNAKRFYA